MPARRRAAPRRCAGCRRRCSARSSSPRRCSPAWRRSCRRVSARVTVSAGGTSCASPASGGTAAVKRIVPARSCQRPRCTPRGRSATRSRVAVVAAMPLQRETISPLRSSKTIAVPPEVVGFSALRPPPSERAGHRHERASGRGCREDTPAPAPTASAPDQSGSLRGDHAVEDDPLRGAAAVGPFDRDRRALRAGEGRIVDVADDPVVGVGPRVGVGVDGRLRVDDPGVGAGTGGGLDARTRRAATRARAAPRRTASERCRARSPCRRSCALQLRRRQAARPRGRRTRPATRTGRRRVARPGRRQAMVRSPSSCR